MPEGGSRMADKIADVMTPRPLTISPDAPVVEAASAMRDADVGDVLVVRGAELTGIITDRDITVRVVADGRDPNGTTVGEISSGNVTAVSPDDDIDYAVSLMRERSLRRLPVVENGQPVGVVSIGDLAVERDSKSALADISAAPPNK
jgi:CBS domain-containing protein